MAPPRWANGHKAWKRRRKARRPPSAVLGPRGSAFSGGARSLPGQRILVKAHHGEEAEGPEPALFHQHEIITHQHAFDVEHRPPTEHVGERRHPALDPAAHAFLRAEVIDDQNLAARSANA